MICSCRTASLRLFVQSMAQLHISEPAAAKPLRRLAGAPRTRVPGAVRPGYAAFSTSPTPRLRDDSHEKDTPEVAEREANTAETEPSASEAHGEQQTPSNLQYEPEKTGNPEDTTTTKKKKKKTNKNKKNAKLEGSQTTSKQETDTSSSAFSGSHTPPPPRRPRETWQTQKEALKAKFPEGWKPAKRLSPDAVAGIRTLHEQHPDEYDTVRLSREFAVSPEAIRRILKSKWTPSAEEEQARQERWFRRGMSVWSRYAELGMKPPQKWRKEGVARDPGYHEKRQAAIAKRREAEIKEKEREIESYGGGGGRGRSSSGGIGGGIM